MNTSNFQVEVDSDTLEDENLKDFEYKTMIKFNDEKLCIDSSDNKEDMVKSREKALEHKRNANLLFKRKKFNEAVVQYKRSIELLDLFSLDEMTGTNLLEIKIECSMNISIIYYIIKDFRNAIKFTENILKMRNDFKTRLIRYKAYSKLSMYKEAIEELKSAMEIRTSKEMQLHLENTKFRYVEALETQEKMSNAYNFVLHIPKLLASTSFPIKVINIMFFILINFIKRNKFLFTFVSIVGVVTLIYEISKNLHKVLYVKF